MKKHGSMNPQGPHEGDMPNLVIDSGGRGTVAAVIPGATMAGQKRRRKMTPPSVR
jgi:Cu-Zn family superoxide dismutase